MNKLNQLVIITSCFLITSCQGQNKKNIFEGSENHSKQSISFNDFNNKGVINFRYAAKKATPAIVHIISKVPYRYTEENDFFNDFFFDKLFPEKRKNESYDIMSASGVLVSRDGYIVTSNHVIDKTENLEVVLYDKRVYTAKIIGFDPLTDLALIKINENELPFLQLGNSDSVQVGDPVLAVGNPFNLASTVTAGIISAKARNINILKSKGAIESFLQTDAAVNKGNSGGALVDINGMLIGINSAIATPTGIYAGYSFAVPVNIVKKVINDLKLYGKVKRGYLGIYISDMNGEKIKETKNKHDYGVYVDSLMNKGAAIEAGIKKNDVIIKIDGCEIESTPHLKEIIATHNPGDKLKVTILREGKEIQVYALLKASEFNEVSTIFYNKIIKELGITIEPLTNEELLKLKINGGIKITKIEDGPILKYTDIKKGFIVTKINFVKINGIEDFHKALENKTDKIIIEGIYPDEEGIFYYGFGIK